VLQHGNEQQQRKPRIECWEASKSTLCANFAAYPAELGIK